MKYQVNGKGHEDGIYVMRHMECYMGEEQGKWDCGLHAKSAYAVKNMCDKLRWKYMAKMLDSPYNLKRQMIIDDAEKYDKNEETKNKEAKDKKKGKKGVKTASNLG